MEEGTAIAAYDLQPHGLEFSQPVTLTLRLPVPTDGGSFLILHYVGGDDGSDDDFEPIEIQDAVVDVDTGLLIATAEVLHFSNVIVQEGAFQVALHTPDSAVVGQPFRATVTVRRTPGWAVSFKVRGQSVTSGDDWTHVWTQVALPGSWTLTGKFLGHRIDPGFVGNRPPLTTVSTSHFTVLQQFTCREPGQATLSYLSTPRGPVSVTKTDRSGNTIHKLQQSWTPTVYAVSKPLCVGPPPTDTPVPTPTPTPNPLAPFATIFAPTATPTSTPTPTPTPTPVIQEVALQIQDQPALDGALGNVPPGNILVFVLDSVAFHADGLTVIEAHVPLCTYIHVHGPPITSALPGPDGKPIERSEHLDECGYGPPNFFYITDPN